MKMKKFQFRLGLGFGIGVSIFFIVRNILDLDIENYTIKILIKTVAIGVVSGVIVGIIFGYLAGKFFPKLLKSIAGVELEADEKPIFESPANYFKSIEAVGGKLFLTNKRLLFKSHKLNFQKSELSVALNDIVKINRFKSLGINNGISVLRTNDKVEKFIVEDPEKWIAELK
jgi:hypothetical protein